MGFQNQIVTNAHRTLHPDQLIAPSTSINPWTHGVPDHLEDELFSFHKEPSTKWRFVCENFVTFRDNEIQTCTEKRASVLHFFAQNHQKNARNLCHKKRNLPDFHFSSHKQTSHGQKSPITLHCFCTHFEHSFFLHFWQLRNFLRKEKVQEEVVTSKKQIWHSRRAPMQGLFYPGRWFSMAKRTLSTVQNFGRIDAKTVCVYQCTWANYTFPQYEFHCVFPLAEDPTHERIYQTHKLRIAQKVFCNKMIDKCQNTRMTHFMQSYWLEDTRISCRVGAVRQFSVFNFLAQEKIWTLFFSNTKFSQFEKKKEQVDDKNGSIFAQSFKSPCHAYLLICGPPHIHTRCQSSSGTHRMCNQIRWSKWLPKVQMAQNWRFSRSVVHGDGQLSTLAFGAFSPVFFFFFLLSFVKATMEHSELDHAFQAVSAKSPFTRRKCIVQNEWLLRSLLLNLCISAHRGHGWEVHLAGGTWKHHTLVACHNNVCTCLTRLSRGQPGEASFSKQHPATGQNTARFTGREYQTDKWQIARDLSSVSCFSCFHVTRQQSSLWIFFQRITARS